MGVWVGDEHRFCDFTLHGRLNVVHGRLNIVHGRLTVDCRKQDYMLGSHITTLMIQVLLGDKIPLFLCLVCRLGTYFYSVSYISEHFGSQNIRNHSKGR